MTTSIRPFNALALMALVCGGVISPTPTAAQSGKPRLMLNTGGPVGAIRALAFSPDGRQLYAAGSGKVVNVWSLDHDEGVPRAIPAAPLRWEIARGMRGRIYTLDVAGPDGQIAVGGYSAREATGDLVLFDSATRMIDALLPRQRSDVPQPGIAPGHTQTVCSIAFSPSGQRLASMSLDGEVRLWDVAAGAFTILQPAGASTDGRVQAVAFLDETRLMIPRPDPNQPAAWRMHVVDPSHLQRPMQVVSQPIFWYGVVDVAVNVDHSLVALSDHLGEVTLLRTDHSLTSRPLNRSRPISEGHVTRTVASMAINSRGLLAITTTADADGQCWLELWETSSDPPRLAVERELGQGTAAAAIAFSPDGQLLTLARADRSAVEVIPLRQDGPMLDLNRAVELTGRGREPGAVRFVGNDGYRIAIDSPGDGVQVQFDLQALEVIDGEISPESRSDDSSGWRLVPQRTDATGQQKLQLFAPGQSAPQGTVSLETSQQGRYRLHTWLTDTQGAVYGVAVATARQDGIFLYGLPASGRCRLMRYLRDHSGAIHSLSVCSDGRFLVSSSADQTIKVWSLAGLQGVNGRFSREDAWGAAFAIQNGRVVVTSAIGPGIAAHRDLLTGDVISQAAFAGPNGVVAASTAADILQALQSVPLWQTLQLTTQRNGQLREPILVTPAWEPVATLFIDHSFEWAFWTPQGVYDSSASGDELFGWHINVGRDQDPQYFRAEKFRRELERPDVMRQLLISGSLQAALNTVAVGAAAPRSLREVAADIPKLRIIAPRAEAAVGAGEQIVVQAGIHSPESPDRDLADFRVRLWVNQRDAGDPQEIQQVDGETQYTWNVAPTAQRNLLRVRVEEIDGGVHGLFNDASVQIHADVPEHEMTLHVMAIAAERYGTGLELKFCNDDAHGVVDLLEQHQGKRYRPGHVLLLTDEQGPESLRREAVQDQIDAFIQQLSDVAADDLLVVFVAGHGQAYGEDYYFLPPSEQLNIDLTDAERETVVREVGIPWEMLRSLADINCRKVFLLDTCYSGNVTLAEKSSIRPLKRSQALVFAATSENELALASNPVRKNHGLFTGFFLEACNGKADGIDAYSPAHPRFVPVQDGNVNLKEVVSYVGFHANRYFQKPKCAPAELLNFVDLSLFQIPADADGDASPSNE